MKILVTGGAGFIGSAVCRFLINETDNEVVNLDALTYAADLTALDSIVDSERYHFEKANICDAVTVGCILMEHQPDAIMHLAAESHVDRSIDGPEAFIQTNIVGTYNMLQEARKYWVNLPENKKNQFRFHHISTDEVYGSLGDVGKFTEETPYKPNSPYSASKASADHLVRAWHKTFGLPVVISNCSNNYGEYQFPEKLIPLLILKAKNKQPLPIYGTGENIRDWLHVDDHARALHEVLTKGRIGEKYNIGGDAELTNIEVVKTVCQILDDLIPDTSLEQYEDLIEFVKDRPGHDLRYAIDFSKITKELGWKPNETFKTGLRRTVKWYLDNIEWCENIAKGRHLERKGNISK